MISSRSFLPILQRYSGGFPRRQLSALGVFPTSTPTRKCYSDSSTYQKHALHRDASKYRRHDGLHRSVHNLPSGLSTRDMAELEDRLSSAVGSKVVDPELNVDLKSLGWANRRLAVSKDGTIQILLKVPSLLHPSLKKLIALVQNAAEKEIADWALETGIELDSAKVNVEAIATKPTPWLVKNVDDQKELESRHGPGLANVAHCIAVYSCKVKKPWDQNDNSKMWKGM